MPLPLGRPDAYILLPISPTKYFIAARQRSTIEVLNSLDRTKVVRQVNTASRDVVANSTENDRSASCGTFCWR